MFLCLSCYDKLNPTKKVCRFKCEPLIGLSCQSAFKHFHRHAYTFICFHTLSYAFIRFHLLSNAFIYASLRFCMLSYAFTMLYKPLHALEAKVSQQEEEARCSAVYRLFLRKPVIKMWTLDLFSAFRQISQM